MPSSDRYHNLIASSAVHGVWMRSRREILLSELDQQHASTLQIITRLDALLAATGDEPGRGSESSRLHQDLANALQSYQAFKHQRLFDPIIRSGPPDKAAIAQQMKAECMMLTQDFRGYFHDRDREAATRHVNAALGNRGRKLLARAKAHIIRERWFVERMLLPPAEARIFGADLRSSGG